MWQRKSEMTYMNERLRDSENKMVSSNISNQIFRENTKNGREEIIRKYKDQEVSGNVERYHFTDTSVSRKPINFKHDTSKESNVF